MKFFIIIWVTHNRNQILAEKVYLMNKKCLDSCGISHLSTFFSIWKSYFFLPEKVPYSRLKIICFISSKSRKTPKLPSVDCLEEDCVRLNHSFSSWNVEMPKILPIVSPIKIRRCQLITPLKAWPHCIWFIFWTHNSRQRGGGQKLDFAL